MKGNIIVQKQENGKSAFCSVLLIKTPFLSCRCFSISLFSIRGGE